MGLNHYFIRSRLVKRFSALNQKAVVQRSGPDRGDHSVYGRDELDVLPVCFVIPGQLNAQKQQLEQEIGERKAIEAICATQDELI